MVEWAQNTAYPVSESLCTDTVVQKRQHSDMICLDQIRIRSLNAADRVAKIVPVLSEMLQIANAKLI